MDVSQFPDYVCHMQVKAVKIGGISAVLGDPTQFVITPKDTEIRPFYVNGDYIKKHSPQIGGYVVVLRDGYVSYSPCGLFEQGYSRV